MTPKEELLGKIDFLREYKDIGIRFSSETPSTAGWVPCFSIDRDESNPSAAVNLQNGFYTDLGTGGRRLDFFSLMQILGGFTSFREVFTKFAEDYGVAIPKGRPSRNPETSVNFLPWTPIADRWCEMKSTSREAVQMCGGEYCKYNGHYFCVGFKIFKSIESLDTIAGYVVAQTNGNPIPVFNNRKEQVSECKIKTVAGSGSGLIGEHALLKISEARNAGTLSDLVVFKVEGVSDMLALQARIPSDQRDKLLVITNSAGCSEKPKPEWASAFTGVKVVLIHDADVPGQKGLANWKSFLRGKAVSVKAVDLPYEVTANHGKDLKDFFTDGHNLEELLDLVREEEEVDDADEEDLLLGMDKDHPERIARSFLNAKYKVPDTEIYTLVYRMGVWFEYQDGCYQTVPESTIVTSLTIFTMELFRRDWEEEYSIWSETGKDSPPKIQKLTNAMITNSVTILKALVFSREEGQRYWRGAVPEWGKGQDLNQLIPVKNGILSLPDLLKTLEKDPSAKEVDRYFYPSTPSLFTLNAFPLDFDRKAISTPWCEMVERNLIDDRTDTSKLDLIQDFFGYCLIPESKIQKFLILTGEGRNGKSAVLMGFSTMIGDINIANVPLESFGDRFSMTSIQYKMVNVVDDLNETDKTCEGKLKSIVSGTAISTDRKNKEMISFRPYCRQIFACNVLPRFQDVSDGIWRRMEVVPFVQQIPAEECRQEYVTRDFWEKEVSGIFNWALGGLIRLAKNNWTLTNSKVVDSEKIQYRHDVNPVLSFFEETLEFSADSKVSSATLYQKYTKWSEENGFRVKNSRNFWKSLKSFHPKIEKRRLREFGKRAWFYVGVRFVEEEGF